MASADGMGKIYITTEELCAFIVKVAPFLGGTEWSLGPIRANEEGIEIDYAFSEECHPGQWAIPPSWLKKESK